MAFGIAKGFGMETLLEAKLTKAMEGQEEVAKRVIEFSHNLLQNTQGGLMAGIGVAILIWTVIKVLGNIEKSFNDIWGVKQHRSLPRKFADYLSIVVVAPILLIMMSSATVAATSGLAGMIRNVDLLKPVATPILYALRLVPYCIGWGLFAFVYIFMPNTKVKLKSAVVAGIVTGTIFTLTQWAYVAFQVGVANYSKVYGSFAALPLFLVWLQLSWLIVLFGAELCFAHQNVDTYEFEPDCLTVSRSFRTRLALRMIQMIVRNFHEGDGRITAEQITHQLDVPIRLVNDTLFELTRTGVLVETKEDDERKVGYQPGRDPELLTTWYVVSKLEKHGSDNIPVEETKEWKKLARCMDEFDEAREKSPGNVLLRDVKGDS